MKNLIFLVGLALVGCGYTSKNNEVVGQIKKVVNKTPIFCWDHAIVDVSLGVMRNGVGSMSGEDVYLYVPPALVDEVTKVAATGGLVKVAYDVKRFSLCVPQWQLTKLEVIQ